MFEEGMPWFVPTYKEVHAFGYGFFHTFTRKTLVGWADIPKEPWSPDLIKDIQEKYHYYSAGFYLPRIAVVSILAIRFAINTDLFNSKESIISLFSILFGV